MIGKKHDLERRCDSNLDDGCPANRAAQRPGDCQLDMERRGHFKVWWDVLLAQVVAYDTVVLIFLQALA